MSLRDRLSASLATAKGLATGEHWQARNGAPPAGPSRAAASPVRRAPAARAPAPGVPASQLERRRDQLRQQLAELQWDLGGLTYEMAIRDHFRLDVLLSRAARLQEVDAELGNLERLLHMEDAGAAGRCPSCGTLYARGAVFCGQCGTRLMDSLPASEAATAVLKDPRPGTG